MEPNLVDQPGLATMYLRNLGVSLFIFKMKMLTKEMFTQVHKDVDANIHCDVFSREKVK